MCFITINFGFYRLWYEHDAHNKQDPLYSNTVFELFSLRYCFENKYETILNALRIRRTRLCAKDT